MDQSYGDKMNTELMKEHSDLEEILQNMVSIKLNKEIEEAKELLGEKWIKNLSDGLIQNQGS